MTKKQAEAGKQALDELINEFYDLSPNKVLNQLIYIRQQYNIATKELRLEIPSGR